MMTIEIRKPDIERRVREGLESGRYRDLDEFLGEALDALSGGRGSHSNTLDWAHCPVVESVPGRLSGAWVFRDTRLPVSTVFSNLEDGATVDEIAEWFRVPKEQVLAVLEFAARSVAAPGHGNVRDAGPF